MKSKSTVAYPRLAQLNVPIYSEPTAHVKGEELKKGLEKAKLDVETFHELFGAQTCVVVEGKGCPYPHDVERCLEEMISGKKSLYWD